MSLSNTNNNMLLVPTNSFKLLEPQQDDNNWFLQETANLKPLSSYGLSSNDYWVDENVMTFNESNTIFVSYRNAVGNIFTEKHENSYEETTDVQTDLVTINQTESVSYTVSSDTFQTETKSKELYKLIDPQNGFNLLTATDTVESIFHIDDIYTISTTTNKNSTTSSQDHFFFDSFFQNIDKAFSQDGSRSASFDFTYDSVNTNLTDFSVEIEKAHADGFINQTEDGLSIEFSCSTIFPSALQNEDSKEPTAIYFELENIESAEEFLTELGDNYAPVPIISKVVDILIEYTGENAEDIALFGTEAIEVDDAGAVA